MTSEPIERLVNAEGLPTHYSQIVRHFWVPLANDIARRAQQEKPLIVGINGAQGSGKTTLCQFMEILLAERGLRAVTLALDDLYLTRSERDRLATEVHPLFATRGVPGTHAPGLGMAIIDAVRKGVSFDMPRFDKIRDDREPERRRIDGPVDVLLFEGWCVDAHPRQIRLNRRKIQREYGVRLPTCGCAVNIAHCSIASICLSCSRWTTSPQCWQIGVDRKSGSMQRQEPTARE